MIKVRRQQQILDLLQESGSLDVTGLSRRLGVSQATIRRDLSQLSDESLIERHYGGATLPRVATAQLPLHSHAKLHAIEQQAIGGAAAALIEDGETVYLSSGTTTFEVARNLTHKKGLTIITGAINIINYLVNFPGLSVIVPGGVLVPKDLSLVGKIAQCALQLLRVDKGVMGVSAIDVDYGITGETLVDAETDRVFIDFVPSLIVVTESKFGLKRAARVAPVTEIDYLVTDPSGP